MNKTIIEYNQANMMAYSFSQIRNGLNRGKQESPYLNTLSFKIKQTIHSQMNQFHSQRKRQYLQNTKNNFSLSLATKYRKAKQKLQSQKPSESFHLKQFNIQSGIETCRPSIKQDIKDKNKQKLNEMHYQQTRKMVPLMVINKNSIREILAKKLKKYTSKKTHSFSNSQIVDKDQQDTSVIQSSISIKSPFLKLQKKKISQFNIRPLNIQKSNIMMKSLGSDKSTNSNKLKKQTNQHFLKTQESLNKDFSHEQQKQSKQPMKKVIESTKFKISKGKSYARAIRLGQKYQSQRFINNIKNSFQQEHFKKRFSYFDCQESNQEY